MLSVSFVSSCADASRAWVVGIRASGLVQTAKTGLSNATQARIVKLIQDKTFKAKRGATLCLYGYDEAPLIVLLGLGEGPLVEYQAYEVGGKLAACLESAKVTQASLFLDGEKSEEAASVVAGAALRSWRFETYKNEKKTLLQEAHVVVSDPEPVQKAFEAFHGPVADSTLWARELINLPSNDLTPGCFVAYLKELASLGLEIEVLDKAKMQSLGMGALLGVAQGSVEPPYLGIVRWQGASNKDEAPLVLVGKGVTFDSGGISIKPSNGMEEMKGDMGGAAVVTGAVRALAMAKAPVNAVAVVALVENMVSGSAQRPGDIVRSMSGKTIEVLNTDAEGRLILADAMSYAQKTFKPKVLVDVATLTGAARHAVGPTFAALLSPSDDLANTLTQLGRDTGEKVWRLPLDPAFEEAMKGTVSDLQNIAPLGFGAGTSTAAQFLGAFVEKDQPWVHLDIASVDTLRKDTPLATRGGCAYGLRLLCRWALS